MSLPDAHQLAEVLARRQEEAGPVTLDLDPTGALMLLAQLQLALRHPANEGAAADFAMGIVETLADYLGAELAPVIAAGFDPASDVTGPGG